MIKLRTWPFDKEIPLMIKPFPGGEQLVRVDVDAADGLELIITLNYESDKDIMALLMTVDAIRRAKLYLGRLEIPYFPAARQDRVCNPGESLSVKVFADLINSLKIPEVVIFDPHSEVTPALINNVTVVNNHKFASDCIVHIKKDHHIPDSDLVLVSPDAGSNKKIFEVSKLLQIPNIRADKLREMSTGKIIETIVYAEDLTGKCCVIVDDIGSYCGTFVALAKVLKAKGARSVYLVVSHWEGVADFDRLYESGINKVYTTNSKHFEIKDDPRLVVSDWNATDL